MSGGYFNYIQHQLNFEVIEPLEEVILNNDKIPYPDADNDFDKAANQEFIDNGCKRFSDYTIDEFNKGLDHIKSALVYINRIDYLLSGDDGEETFHRRLKDDLAKINTTK